MMTQKKSRIKCPSLGFSTVTTVRAGAFTTFRYTFLPLSGISTPCTSVSLDISPRSFFTV